MQGMLLLGHEMMTIYLRAISIDNLIQLLLLGFQTLFFFLWALLDGCRSIPLPVTTLPNFVKWSQVQPVDGLKLSYWSMLNCSCCRSCAYVTERMNGKLALCACYGRPLDEPWLNVKNANTGVVLLFLFDSGLSKHNLIFACQKHMGYVNALGWKCVWLCCLA